MITWLKRMFVGADPVELDITEHLVSAQHDWERRERERLRDHFAGQALAGTNPFELSGWGDAEIAERFYQIADAMLAERERRQ
ncbi:MAG: hypothetical protein ACOY4P_07415 [Pseudomonadota bacterium]